MRIRRLATTLRVLAESGDVECAQFQGAVDGSNCRQYLVRNSIAVLVLQLEWPLVTIMEYKAVQVLGWSWLLPFPSTICVISCKCILVRECRNDGRVSQFKTDCTEWLLPNWALRLSSILNVGLSIFYNNNPLPTIIFIKQYQHE